MVTTMLFRVQGLGLMSIPFAIVSNMLQSEYSIIGGGGEFFHRRKGLSLTGHTGQGQSVSATFECSLNLDSLNPRP